MSRRSIGPVLGALLVASLVVTALGAGAAVADESYSTYDAATGQRGGDIYYDTDYGNDAIWRSNDQSRYYYIYGMAGIYQNRGIYDGYWIDMRPSYSAGAINCPSGTAGDHFGNQYPVWGRFRLDWTQYGNNPQHWVMYTGQCDNELGSDGVITSLQTQVMQPGANNAQGTAGKKAKKKKNKNK